MAFYLIWTSQTLNSKIRYGSSKKVQNGAENWQNCLIAWKGGNGKISKSFHPLKEILLAYFASKSKKLFLFYCKSKSHLNKSLLQTCCVFIHWYNWVKIVTHHLIGQFYKMNCHLSFLLSFLYFFCSPLFFNKPLFTYFSFDSASNSIRHH